MGLFNFFVQDIAIDLGTANTIIYYQDKVVVDQPSIVAKDIKTGKAVDMYLDATPELRGYSGMCLPKDTKAIMNLMEELNINLDLIKAIESDNSKFRKTVFNGMRGEE